MGESKSAKWTAAENKMFENALAFYDKDTPERWQQVAAWVPGKTVRDVMEQYQELENDISSIEAGLFPLPTYDASPFTLELANGRGSEVFKHGCGKRPISARPDLERKKGVPWTEEEHKQFLMGLKKYGKGDWRNISRNFVITRTPTQVASHAQKYFIRQVSGGKDKRRASIHDITTVDTQNPSMDNNQTAASLEQPQAQPNSGGAVAPRASMQWNQPSYGATMGGFNGVNDNVFGSSPYGVGSLDLSRESYIGSQSMAFPLLSRQDYLYG